MAPQLVIRTPRDGERSVVERLEDLDDRRLEGGDLLLAEVDGEPWAAVAIDTGDAVADPFRPTGEVVAALRAAAASLRAAGAGRPLGRQPGASRRANRRRYLRRGRARALQQVHRAPA